MARLIVTHAFEADLDALEAAGTAAHLDAVDAAVVLLEELAGNLSVLSDLFRPGMRHNHDPLFEVKRFEQAWRNGFNVLILKYWDTFGSLADYRIFVGYHAQKETFYVLAITHRAIAYDVGDDAYNALLARYQSCNIPAFP